MKKIKVNKLIYSLIVSISGLLLSLFVNRGYFIIESVVGTEYKNIMSSEKLRIMEDLVIGYLRHFFQKYLMIFLFLIF